MESLACWYPNAVPERRLCDFLKQWITIFGSDDDPARGAEKRRQRCRNENGIPEELHEILCGVDVFQKLQSHNFRLEKEEDKT